MKRTLLCIVIVFALGFASTLFAQQKKTKYKFGQPTVPNLPGEKGARYPTLSPDGSLISFTLHGDIWVMPAQGGVAKRITMHRAYDICSRFSPDGTMLAFSSNRGHGYDVYVVPVAGGKPRKITVHPFPDFVSTWAPDGQSMLVVSSRSLRYQIWQVPIAGGTPKCLTKLGAIDGAMSQDGKYLVYAYGTADAQRCNYKGTGNWDLYLQDLSSGSKLPRKLTDTPYNEFDPFFSADGKYVFYRAEINGTYQIFMLSIAPGAKPLQITKFKGGTGAEELFYEPKKKVLLFSREFYIFKIDLSKKKPKIEHIPVLVKSDVRGDDEIEHTYTKGADSPDISPDGKYIAFSLRDDLWIMPAQGGVAKQLTDTPYKEDWPRFSPDGKKIAYYANPNPKAGYDIFILDLATHKSERITTNEKDDFFQSFSPDGKYLVFTSNRDGDKDIYLVKVDKPHTVIQLTNAPGSDDDASFTPDGKHIVFDSGRTGNQGIYIMDVNGDNQRLLYNSPNFEQLPRVSPDGKFVVFESIPEKQDASVMMMRITGGQAMQVVSVGSGPFFTPDGNEIIYGISKIILKNGVRTLSKSIYRIKAPKEINVGTEIPMIAEVKTSLKKENLKVFEEAWNTLKENFYDKNMHGVDWDAIKKKYKPLIEKSELKEEVYNLINRMIGELSASHLGQYGYTEFSRPQTQAGYLGIEGEVVRTARGYAFHISSVLPNSPADKVWLRAGDNIFAVGNKRLSSKTNFYALLENTVGKEIRLLVSPGSDFDHGRFITIKPVSYRDIYSIKYHNWLVKRVRLVSKLTRNRIAYVHLTMMDAENLTKFKKTVMRANALGQKALIIDCRNNGGGRIHEQLLDILLRKPYGYYSSRRFARKVRAPQLYWDKPVVVLVNERSFSDAELFPAAFQNVKRGLVIGVHTPGDVIGTMDITLSDGSTFRVPSTGWFDTKGHNLEGRGAKPDIEVKLSLEDRLYDRDPQLKKACEVLMKMLYPPQTQPQTQPKKKQPQTQKTNK